MSHNSMVELVEVLETTWAEEVLSLTVILLVFVISLFIIFAVQKVIEYESEKVKCVAAANLGTTGRVPNESSVSEQLFRGYGVFSRTKSYIRSKTTRHSVYGVIPSRAFVRQLWRKIRRKIWRDIPEGGSEAVIINELPDAFLEAKISLPSVMWIPELVHHSVKRFGDFDISFTKELGKNLNSRMVQAGVMLFQQGEPCDSIFIVHAGRLRMFIVQPNGTELTLKIVSSGDCISSLLCFINFIRGYTSEMLSLWCRAEQDSVILELPFSAIKEQLYRQPEQVANLVNLIVIRLHQINLTVLCHHLVLSFDFFSEKYAVKTKRDFDTEEESKLSLALCTQPIIDVVEEAVPTRTHHTSISLPDVTVTDSSRNSGTLLSRSVSGIFNSENRARDTPPVSVPEETESLSNLDYYHMAATGLSNILRISEEVALKIIELREIPEGCYVISNKSEKDVAIIYIIEGTFAVEQTLTDSEYEPIEFLALKGEIVAGMTFLPGAEITVTISVTSENRVAVISKGNLQKLTKSQPDIQLHIYASLANRFSLFVRQVDFALDWNQLESGKSLYRQGDPSGYTFIVLSGRLRSVLRSDDGKKHILGEFGKGDLIGMAEMLTEQVRSTTVIAVRDTQVVKVPADLLKTINILHPGTLMIVMKRLGSDLIGNFQTTSSAARPIKHSLQALLDHNKSVFDTAFAMSSNFSTVAVLPISNSIPIGPFTFELYHAIKNIDKVLYLTKDEIISQLGPMILEGSSIYKLNNWLSEEEDKYRIILFQCETELTYWTRCCLHRADIILLVTSADLDTSVTEIEIDLVELTVRTQKDLIILHKDDGKKPQNTSQWLNERGWLSNHHHVRCPRKMFYLSHEKLMPQQSQSSPSSRKRKTWDADQMKNAIEASKIYLQIFQPDVHTDIARLARYLTGTSVGVVLGGGGARGAAHVGFIRAMMESNVPIDMVGGVSIGAFMGALWCMEHSERIPFVQKAKEWSLNMTSTWRQIIDLTFPCTAMFTGYAFNKSIHDVFLETQVEDLWLPFFCVTTDLTDNVARVHLRGSLWRYIRASMTLAGYLPPMCDPVDGHLLVDGGYCNILPADIMQNKGTIKTIFAVDVSKHDEEAFSNYGDTLSGFRVILSWINPYSHFIVPGFTDIQARLALSSGVRALEEVRQSTSFHYVRPPVNNFETLQFGSFEEIKDIGYTYTKELLLTMKEDGTLPNFLNIS